MRCRVFSNMLRPLAWLTASLSLLAAALSVSTHWTSASAKSNPVTPAPNAIVTPNKDDNPTVTPGLVKWHKSFEVAKTASVKSGKPALLFHMMGQLDKQFC